MRRIQGRLRPEHETRTAARFPWTESKQVLKHNKITPNFIKPVCFFGTWQKYRLFETLIPASEMWIPDKEQHGIHHNPTKADTRYDSNAYICESSIAGTISALSYYTRLNSLSRHCYWWWFCDSWSAVQQLSSLFSAWFILICSKYGSPSSTYP